MYLPNTSAIFPNGSFDLAIFKSDSKHGAGGWSSLIGVVTAICGNILISFALNTQRYAHMRLSRDRDARSLEKRRAARRKGARQSGSYGARQSEIAEERARQHAKSEPNGYTLEQREEEDDDDDGTETSPLIPKLAARKPSGLSGETAQEEDQEQETEPKEKSYLKSPIWWVGITLMVLGEIGNFLAYGFAPASIVSPLGVVALISNCIIAPLLLGEHFRWRDALGVVIAIAGCVVVVLSASASNPKLTPEHIWELVTTWEFETYLGITIFLIIVLAVLSNKYGQKSILVDLGLVALFGGYTALSTKGVASLLTYKIWKVVTFPITYLLVAVLVFTAVMQIKYVNRALQRFNATMVIPTQFVLFTISVILGSAILYRDFEREETGDGIKFVSGCALTFFGVWCITSGRKSESEESDEPGDEEDAISLVDEEIQSERHDHAQGTVPTIRRHHTAGELLQTPQMNATSSTNAPTAPPLVLSESVQNVPPATASAIHTDTSGPLLSSDNTNSPSSPRKPPFHATTSEPVIPTTPTFSTSLRPKTPLFTRTPSHPTGTESPHRGHLDPNNRLSVVGLLPGPLTSPLSGSLAAIVADELRRGTTSPAGTLNKHHRRQRLPPAMGSAAAAAASLRRPQDASTPGDPVARKRHSIASVEFADADEAARIAAGSPREAGGAGRIRSLSATLSDMFGGGGSASGSSLRRQRTLEERRREDQQQTQNKVSSEQEEESTSAERGQ